ncbi:cuticle protein 6-like [Pollicipes pollicipes]|uniref:cuticle protein 6-like n=1 Tax=Pollicipes pollicipes TaxID=41117 RepID=UPI001885130C|nr:cuticle protein 6-like [Pollicipes pollicipes]
MWRSHWSAVLALGLPSTSPVGYTSTTGTARVATTRAGAYNHYAPTVYSAAPAATVSSQYHAQDELGQFQLWLRRRPVCQERVPEVRWRHRWQLQLLDANGKVQTVSYTADDVNGFPAPVFNLEAPVFDGVAPEPVQDTAEVAAAKAGVPQEVKKVEVKHVASPITYAASPLPLAYGLHPYGYGAPLIYNVEAKEEDCRSVPAVKKVEVKAAPITYAC